MPGPSKVVCPHVEVFLWGTWECTFLQSYNWKGLNKIKIRVSTKNLKSLREHFPCQCQREVSPNLKCPYTRDHRHLHPLTREASIIRSKRRYRLNILIWSTFRQRWAVLSRQAICSLNEAWKMKSTQWPTLDLNSSWEWGYLEWGTRITPCNRSEHLVAVSPSSDHIIWRGSPIGSPSHFPVIFYSTCSLMLYYFSFLLPMSVQ